MQAFQIIDDIYKVRIFVYLNPTKKICENIDNIFNKNDIQYDKLFLEAFNSSSVGGRVAALDNFNIYVAFFVKPCQGIIAHESLHIAKRVLMPRGIFLQEELSTEEAYAYYIEFLVKKINDGLFSKNKTKRKAKLRITK